MALLTLEEVKEALGTSNPAFAQPDGGLLLRYNAAEADVVRMAGGLNRLGVAYNDLKLRVSLYAVDATNWLDPIETSGDRSVEQTYAYGTNNPVLLADVLYTAGGENENIANVTLDFQYANGTADGLNMEGMLPNASLYIERDNKLYEWTVEGRVINDGMVIYSRPSGDTLGTKLTGVFNTVVAGDQFNLILADAGAFVPTYGTGGLAVMKEAVIELLKLKLMFDARKSFRDGTYNQTVTDFAVEQERILQTVAAAFT